MAAVTITQQNAYHGTLTANAADNVTLLNPSGTITVINRSGTSEIYFTTDGTSVATAATQATGGTGGNNSYVLPASIGALTVTQTQAASVRGATAPPGVKIQLISTGTPTYSVEVI